MSDTLHERLARKKEQQEKVPERPLTGIALANKISADKKARRFELVEKAEEAGQPVNQNSVNQLTSDVNQPGDVLVNQSESQTANRLTKTEVQPVNQLTNEKQFRTRRERKLKGLRLPAQKLEKWQLWCFINKFDFQDAVEVALDWLTSQPIGKLNGQLDNHVLIDDFEDNKETDEGLIFYRKWTGNKITPKDRLTKQSVERFSDEIIKIGILTAISRATKKINSFAYCVPVIEEMAEDAEVIKDKSGYLSGIERFIERARKGK